jgi:hypothetical protein
MAAGSGGEGGYSGYGTEPGSTTSDVSAHDKPVEIYGVVYLYNPVDLKKLGIEKKEADPSAPAIPAADAPAVGAAMAAPESGDLASE